VDLFGIRKIKANMSHCLSVFITKKFNNMNYVLPWERTITMRHT